METLLVKKVLNHRGIRTADVAANVCLITQHYHFAIPIFKIKQNGKEKNNKKKKANL